MTEIYKLCNRCVMDTSAKEISFDSLGICNFCNELDFTIDSIQNKGNEYFNLDELVAKIKTDGKGKMYDCIVGVSGGVDSSYTLFKVVKLGLRPLAVHLDNGWNSELAVSNINNLISNLNVDLYTHVIDWKENRDMQLSFFKANVIDIEMIMDNAQAALNFKIAKKYNLHYILSGSNTATEGILAPQDWTQYKFDVKNIKAIHKKFGSLKIKTHPLISTIDYLIYKKIHKIDWVFFLDYLTYNKTEALNILKQELDYKPYPYKHYESVFTRFYQGYILPKKFNVDKRRMHLSSLIINGELSRVEALDLLKQEPYSDKSLLQQDMAYVIKKLGLTKEEFELYINTPGNKHSDFPSEEGFFKFLLKLSKMFKN
jgi:N-acetyl sugar amidotransferase